MGFAATNKPISFSSIPIDTVALILSGLHSILGAVGWTSTVISGGHQYTIADPTSTLGAKVRIYDDGSTDARVQFLSLNELVLGNLHRLSARAGRSLQVWANCCSLFTSQVGVTTPDATTGLCSLSGGIPFIPPDLLGDCGVDRGPTLATEVWWSEGDDNIFDTTSFRRAIVSGSWCACYNGTLINSGPTESVLRLIPKSIALPWPLFFGATPRTRYFGGTQLFFEPLIGWGDAGVPTKIRGQIYDAAMGSITALVDDRLTTQGFNFINYSGDPPGHVDSTRFSSLYLLLGAVGSTGSYGYVY